MSLSIKRKPGMRVSRSSSLPVPTTICSWLERSLASATWRQART